MISTALRGDRLFPVFRGVFAVGHPAIGDRGRAMAAVLACGRAAAVSHMTAAALLGLREGFPSSVDVIAKADAGRGIDGIRRHMVPLPEKPERLRIDGVPCASPARTLVDLAGVLGRKSLREAIERAAVLDVLDLAAIDATLARSRRRGAPALRSLLIPWRAIEAGDGRDPLRLRSALEARLLALLAAGGVPAPLCNHTLTLDTARYELDMLWPSAHLVVELDGRAFHSGPASFEEDRQRDRQLTLAGYTVLRLTWGQVDREAEAVIRAIRRLLPRRGRPAVGPLAWRRGDLDLGAALLDEGRR